MNHKTWCLNISAAVLCLSSACAGAAEPGFYVTASLGTGDEDPKSVGTNFATSLFIFHIDPDQVTVDDGDLADSVVHLSFHLTSRLAARCRSVQGRAAGRCVEWSSVLGP